MSPSYHRHNHQNTTDHPRIDAISPLERLRTPHVVSEIYTKLLASRDLDGGGVDELHYQTPSRTRHPGIIFYTTDIPVSGPRVPEGVRELHRILFTRVPATDSDQFIRDVIEAFHHEKSPQFANTFTAVFNAEVMLDQIGLSESSPTKGPSIPRLDNRDF